MTARQESGAGYTSRAGTRSDQQTNSCMNGRGQSGERSNPRMTYINGSCNAGEVEDDECVAMKKGEGDILVHWTGRKML